MTTQKTLSHPHGVLKATLCEPGDDGVSGLARMFSLSEFDACFEDAIAMAVEEAHIRLAIVESLVVDPAHRGRGIGAELMRRFVDTVGPQADAMMLIADIEVPQHKGLKLPGFYAQFGLLPAAVSCGHLVMASEPLAGELNKACALRRPGRPEEVGLTP